MKCTDKRLARSFSDLFNLALFTFATGDSEQLNLNRILFGSFELNP